MAKYTKQELAEAKKETKQLLRLILDKTGVSHKYLIAEAENSFIAANLDVVTPVEKKRFKSLIF